MISRAQWRAQSKRQAGRCGRHFKDITEPLVRDAQSLGLKVVPWTVNDEADLLRLLDWKVDGLITDYPDRLRALMKARGMALPTQYPPKL
jgi:glycerophosphoryl diester phosphodiesterase